jgi:RNA polymerase sigma factor for flagellar operon FliA
MGTEFITHGQQREKDVLRFLPMVRHLVGKMAINLPSFFDTEDLVEAGVVGLIAAVDSYQPGYGTVLSTHVYTRVKGAIIDEIRKFSCFSREFHQKMKKLQENYKNLEENLQRSPSLDELVAVMGVSHEELGELLTALHSRVVLSLEQSMENDDGKEDGIIAMLSAPGQDMPQDALEREEMSERLAEAIAQLPERERQIIVLYYYQGLLLQEISEILGVTPARVSHLHTRALYQLNQMLSTEIVAQ